MVCPPRNQTHKASCTSAKNCCKHSITLEHLIRNRPQDCLKVCLQPGGGDASHVHTHASWANRGSAGLKSLGARLAKSPVRSPNNEGLALQAKAKLHQCRCGCRSPTPPGWRPPSRSASAAGMHLRARRAVRYAIPFPLPVVCRHTRSRIWAHQDESDETRSTKQGVKCWGGFS